PLSPLLRPARRREVARRARRPRRVARARRRSGRDQAGPWPRTPDAVRVLVGWTARRAVSPRAHRAGRAAGAQIGRASCREGGWSSDVCSSDLRSPLYYDQRGGGKSPVGRDVPVGWREHVADLDGIRQVLGLERLTLCGYSWGGLLAVLYLLEHTERVERLAL